LKRKDTTSPENVVSSEKSQLIGLYINQQYVVLSLNKYIFFHFVYFKHKHIINYANNYSKRINAQNYSDKYPTRTTNYYNYKNVH